MWYVRGSSPVAKVFQIYLSSASIPCCVILCPTKDPDTISSHHSLNCTSPLCRSRPKGPSPVIRRLHAASDWVPAAWHEQQNMPTVFPKFIHMPTLSNRPTRIINAPRIHHGYDDATVPLSA